MMALRSEGPSPTGPATVLVVDDEPDIVSSLCMLLETELEHATARGAASGEEALRQLDDVDLLVTDFRMPGMDGLHLAREARARVPDLPTILLTAFADKELADQAAKGGNVTVFLSKPVPMDTFVASVRSLLQA